MRAARTQLWIMLTELIISQPGQKFVFAPVRNRERSTIQQLHIPATTIFKKFPYEIYINDIGVMNTKEQITR